MGAIDEELTFFLNSQIHNELIKIAESVRPVLWSVTTCEASHGQQTKDRRSLSSKYVVSHDSSLVPPSRSLQLGSHTPCHSQGSTSIQRSIPLSHKQSPGLK